MVTKGQHLSRSGRELVTDSRCLGTGWTLPRGRDGRERGAMVRSADPMRSRSRVVPARLRRVRDVRASLRPPPAPAGRRGHAIAVRRGTPKRLVHRAQTRLADGPLPAPFDGISTGRGSRRSTTEGWGTEEADALQRAQCSSRRSLEWAQTVLGGFAPSALRCHHASPSAPDRSGSERRLDPRNGTLASEWAKARVPIRCPSRRR